MSNGKMGVYYGSALYMPGGDYLCAFGYIDSFRRFKRSLTLHSLAVLAVLWSHNGDTGIDAVVSGKDNCRGTKATAADLGPHSNGGTIIFHPRSGRNMVDTDGNLG
jgi:hypothetical protein